MNFIILLKKRLNRSIINGMNCNRHLKKKRAKR